jgi:hypothetical protein
MVKEQSLDEIEKEKVTQIEPNESEDSDLESQKDSVVHEEQANEKSVR